MAFAARPGRIGRVQIGILGPFEVRTDAGGSADVPGARLRGLLAGPALTDSVSTGDAIAAVAWCCGIGLLGYVWALVTFERRA